jgi:hypothetical protein
MQYYSICAKGTAEWNYSLKESVLSAPKATSLAFQNLFPTACPVPTGTKDFSPPIYRWDTVLEIRVPSGTKETHTYLKITPKSYSFPRPYLKSNAMKSRRITKGD